MIVFEVVTQRDPSKGKDVDTSKAAWEHAKYEVTRSRQIILDALVSVKGTEAVGYTVKEISALSGISMHKLSGRATELREIGAIRKTDLIRGGGHVLEAV